VLDEDGFRHVAPGEDRSDRRPSGIPGAAGEILRQLAEAAGPAQRQFVRELGEAWRRDRTGYDGGTG
jgi:hypothetical protein